MTIDVILSDPTSVHCDALIVGVVGGGGKQPKWTARVDGASGGVISRLIAEQALDTDVGAVAAVVAAFEGRSQRLLLVGLGEASAPSAEDLRRATGRAVRWLARHGGGHAVTTLHCGREGQGNAARAAAVADAAVLGGFVSPGFGERAQQEATPVTRLDLVETTAAKKRLVAKAAQSAAVVAEGANYARHLAELPSNILTPTRIGDAARELLEPVGIKVEVHDEAWIQKQGMGALYGVGQGSEEPSRFIILEHKPRGARRHVVLVGKGVSFDTGGISIKPREGMERMKYDMAGAAAVIGTMFAVGKLGARDRVTALVPTAENMPDGKAIKPGDVLMTASGKSVEITNTDAEGRLVLADGLDYGAQLEPDVMIDLATLTGACKIALAGVACGVMGNDAALIKALGRAGERSGEWAWHLPLTPELFIDLKSDVADMKNFGGRAGGALVAASFLEQYVRGRSWAHLDIAGVAWTDRDLGHLKMGASGFGVRLLASFLDL